MMKNNVSIKKVALVTESLWKMAGSNRVLEVLTEQYPEADIFVLFGSKEKLSDTLKERNIFYSFLNRFPLVKHLYRYTFFLWPIAIENLDFSNYDLVISVSSSVAHGVITPLNCKHVVYLNTPMRYAWDLSFLYRDVVKFCFLKRVVSNFFLTINRVWDVIAAQRPDIIIANSNFVASRAKKYWDREVDGVIYPPSVSFGGEIKMERADYFVAGAPFEPNKRGDFLLECASKLGFNLKVIGGGSMKKKLKRKYKQFNNIEFLDWINEQDKWELISKSKGFLIGGIEDYGIFCAEAISCGTPVLAYAKGGSLEIVKGDVNGLFFKEWNLDSFNNALGEFNRKNWDYEMVSKSLESVNSREGFKNKIAKLVESKGYF
jgi:glycosyltransferase involved in cell wall biosynthesis